MNRLKLLYIRYTNLKLETKATLWYVVCNFLQKGFAFFLVPIYIRMLSSTEYGEFTVFQSWRDIIAIVATLNLYCGVYTRAMVEYKDDRDRYTASMQGLSTIITGVFLVLYLVFKSQWNQLLNCSTATGILMIIYFVTFPAVQFWSVRQRVEYRYKRMVAISIICSLAGPIMSIILLKCTTMRSEAVIWGHMSVYVIIGSFLCVYHWVKSPCFYNKIYWDHALKFNIPLIPHYLSLVLLGQSDRIMIERYCGADKTAVYNLAYQISMVMTIFISAINNSFVPWFYEQMKKNNRFRIGQVSRTLCVFVGSMTIVAILVSPEMVWILGTPEYYDAIWIVPAVAGSTYYTFCYGLFSNVEFYYGATKYVMIASILGALTNVMLNFMLIPKLGFIAAGYTTLISYLLLMIVHYYFMCKACKLNKESTRIFDMRFIKFSVVITLLLIGLCLLIYKYTVIRYAVIGTMMMCVIINRKRIKNIFKTIKGEG